MSSLKTLQKSTRTYLCITATVVFVVLTLLGLRCIDIANADDLSVSMQSANSTNAVALDFADDNESPDNSSDSTNENDGMLTTLADGVMTYFDPTTNSEQTADDVTTITADTTLTDGWYASDGEVTISSALTVSGDVNIILTDGRSLTIPSISVKKPSSLTIWGQ